MSLPSRIITAAGLVILLSPAAVPAQVRTTGSIVGTVRDASGALVPDAQIEITDIGTGVATSSRSGKAGEFVFPALQPGRYRLLATAAGFEPAVLADLVVDTGRTTSVTVLVQVAGVQEQVKVQAALPVIETTTSTV